MRRVKLISLLLVAVIAAVLLIRTYRFRSLQPAPEAFQAAQLNPSELAERLSAALRFQTISQQDAADFQDSDFIQMRSYLEQQFPLVHASLNRELVEGYTLLYTWKGQDESLKPILVMAHQDVVPSDPETSRIWKHPPFSGTVADGYVWGRGAVDDKGSLFGILEATEYLLRAGYRPQRTVYFVFGHNEEVGGSGAGAAAALLQSRRVQLESVLDEGLVIVDGAMPGVKDPVALIGISEKGYISVRLSVTQDGGHSSMPPRFTSVGVLSKAIVELEKRPVPARLDGAVVRMFEYVGPEMSFGNRLMISNLWLFAPLLRFQLSRKPSTNALIRTTTAPTMFTGSPKENVLPKTAVAVVNFRILPGDSTKDVLDHVRNTIRNDAVKIEAISPVEPSPVSPSDAPSFLTIQKTVRQVFPDTIVAPGLVVGGTDARHFTALTKCIYCFVPIPFRQEDLARLHGVDERIAVEDYARSVQFYIQYIRNATLQK